MTTLTQLVNNGFGAFRWRWVKKPWEEQENLKTELKELLDSLTYSELALGDAEIVEATSKVFQQVPTPIFIG